MLQSLSISDYKQSPQSIFNSLQSQAVIKSVNLNSGVKSSAIKSSASKRLHSECNSELQLSVSSENSKLRSYSLQSNRPTVNRNLNHNQSQIETVSKKIISETKETKFLSINQNEYVSEFNYKKDSQGLQNKVTILIEENKKLILINEQLMQELEKTKLMFESNNQTVLLQSLQRETQSLQQTIFQYKKINNQQSQQINQLQQLLNEKEEMNNQQLSLNLSKNQQILYELQQNYQYQKEQLTNLQQQYLLKCFELERINQFGDQQQQWKEKFNILIKENENLNNLLQKRLNEYISLQQQYKNQNDIIVKLEYDISQLQQQITEQNFGMTKKNQDQINLIQEVNKKYEIKNEENRKLSEQIQCLESKWRQKCIEFEKEMKISYSNKLNKEIRIQLNYMNEEYQRSIQNYLQTIAVQQAQLQILQKQNEQLHKTNCQNTNIKEWQHEKNLYFEIINELQTKISELTNQLTYIINQNNQSNYDSEYSTLGINDQLKQIDENKKYNEKIYQRCQEIMSKRFYF